MDERVPEETQGIREQKQVQKNWLSATDGASVMVHYAITDVSMFTVQVTVLLKTFRACAPGF